ncbi:CRISPR-associated protein Cas2 [Microvirga sp. CF3016]|uniref:CRISPR-associated protein Cas2 n=1 Tax=Microvirga sp. CF3016 TaxID=3110181 RepID=UPI002E787B1B|nr:CRISPR-associated protein Cas2 [Microvirga sp. CF3016]MEE1612087.1 CRISPR-associated protein Cas2 [Microvirga sp. CF3016]
MAVYVMSYDLVNEAEGTYDYRPLWSELKRLGAHRTQYSTWLVDLDNTPQEIVEHFQQYVDNNDRLMVTKLTKEYWYDNAIGGTKAWLAARTVS